MLVEPERRKEEQSSMKRRSRITPEMKEYILQITPGRYSHEAVVLFNENFNMNLTLTQYRSYLSNHRIRNGMDGRFKKGQVSWNFGKKGTHFSPATEFKKGSMPVNHRPVGSERINTEGYIEVKVEEPKKWLAKHTVIYENTHGPIPKSHVVLFLDGNKENLDINNLRLVSRAELAVLNKNRLLSKEKELSESGLLIAKLLLKSNKLGEK